jgi:hypothetical protein
MFAGEQFDTDPDYSRLKNLFAGKIFHKICLQLLVLAP